MLRRLPGTLVALLASACFVSLSPAADPEPAVPSEPGEPSAAERAVRLYDEERYEEARAALEALDAAGRADGPLLYRLSFCLDLGAEREARGRTLARAVAALERETAEHGGLESWFYLSGAYRSQGRTSDAARVAAEATRRIESGALPKTERPVDLFRVGKLYEDQQRADEAAAWYRRALEGFAERPGAFPAYVRWSRRYLGNLLLARSDWEGAEREYAALAAEGKAQAGDWFRLAVARARGGRWEGAAEAWRESERADPAGGDDARYARQLALQAAEVGTLPSFSQDGRTWNLLEKEDLERTLLASAQVAQDASARLAAEGAPLDPALREGQARELAEARRIFLAAGIEYAARGLPIRETAFEGGYAPLVFHADRWKVPEPERAGEEPARP